MSASPALKVLLTLLLLVYLPFALIGASPLPQPQSDTGGFDANGDFTPIVPAGGFESWIPEDQPCPANTYLACTAFGFNICAPDLADSRSVSACGIISKRLEAGELESLDATDAETQTEDDIDPFGPPSTTEFSSPGGKPCPSGTFLVCTESGFNICSSKPNVNCGNFKKRLEAGETGALSQPHSDSEATALLKRDDAAVTPAPLTESWVPSDQPCPFATYLACTAFGFNICAPDIPTAISVSDCGTLKRLEAGENVEGVVIMKRQTSDGGAPLMNFPGTLSSMQQRQNGDEIEPNTSLDSAGSPSFKGPSFFGMGFFTLVVVFLSLFEFVRARAVVPRSNETAEFGYDLSCSMGWTPTCLIKYNYSCNECGQLVTTDDNQSCDTVCKCAIGKGGVFACERDVKEDASIPGAEDIGGVKAETLAAEEDGGQIDMVMKDLKGIA